MSQQPIYSAIYSGVTVYEMSCRNVSVMRRKQDNYLNATQILKVAGVDKGRRTKILEREVQIGKHEKVQGGYGKYQGTWIPFERGVDIARQYGVEDALRPLFDYQGLDTEEETPNKKPKRPPTQKKKEDLQNQPPQQQPSVNTYYHVQPSMPPQKASTNGERYRAILMSVFLNHESHKLPDLLTNQNPPADLDIDLIIDDQGHTSLHWAAALARLPVLKLLLKLGADPRKMNFSGESALIRAVLVTNNYDQDSFYELLTLLHQCIDMVDKKGRSVLHHIALTAGIKGRLQAARYYLDNVMEMTKKSGLDLNAFLDLQDKNGDTALNIGARIGMRSLVEGLLKAGANPELPNRAGLRPIDFGLEDRQLVSLFQPQLSHPFEELSHDHSMVYQQKDGITQKDVMTQRGREMANEVSQTIASLESDLHLKQQQLEEALLQIKQTCLEISEVKRQNRQLVDQVATLQFQLQNGIKDEVDQKEGEPTDMEAMKKEILRLKTILSLNQISYLPNDSSFGTNPDDETERKASKLLAQCLDVDLETAEGLLDPLLVAVASEKKSQSVSNGSGDKEKHERLDDDEEDAMQLE